MSISSEALPGVNGNTISLRSIHTTLQLRCDADISIAFCRKSSQQHRISSYNLTFMQHCNAVTLQFLCFRLFIQFFAHFENGCDIMTCLYIARQRFDCIYLILAYFHSNWNIMQVLTLPNKPYVLKMFQHS